MLQLQVAKKKKKKKTKENNSFKQNTKEYIPILHFHIFYKHYDNNLK